MWHRLLYDEAHALVYRVELPFFGDKFKISGRQWALPVDETHCIFVSVDTVHVTGFPGLNGTIERGLEKGALLLDLRRQRARHACDLRLRGTQTAAATKLQAVARGRADRAASSDKIRASGTELPSAGQSTICEGWLTKRGSGFPFKWQRRYFVLDCANRLRYYAANSDGGGFALKGEVEVVAVTDSQDKYGLCFEISLTARSNGRDKAQARAESSGFDTPRTAEQLASRSLLARAPDEDERQRWVSVKLRD